MSRSARWSHALWLLLGSLWLASCATTPSPVAPNNATVNWNQRVQTLSDVQDWDLHALIAIRARDHGDSATLQWQQQKDHYTINLFGPLGTNAYRLQGAPGKVSLENAQGKTVTATSPEALIAQQTGWRLPVSYLHYWIRGLPVPGIPTQQQFDAYYHLSTLAQAGWNVQFLRYTSVGAIDLPSKIFIASPDLEVKIIINRWQL